MTKGHRTGPVIVLRALALMLFALALGMLGARMLGGLDIPLVTILGQITIGISLMVVSSSIAKKQNKPD